MANGRFVAFGTYSLSTVLLTIPVEKDEFETSEAFQVRRSRAASAAGFGGPGMVVVGFTPDPSEIRYDADAGMLHVFAAATGASATSRGALLVQDDEESRQTTLSLVEPGANTPIFAGEEGFEISVPAIQARALKENGQVFFAFSPSAPYVRHDSRTGQRGTHFDDWNATGKIECVGFGLRGQPLAAVFDAKRDAELRKQVSRVPPAEIARPSILTNPDWIRKPSGDEITRAYPVEAQRAEMDGRATLSCIATAAGTLSECQIVSETPGDYGFGKAALALATKFKMNPRGFDGRDVVGGTVRIPIIFRTPF